METFIIASVIVLEITAISILIGLRESRKLSQEIKELNYQYVKEIVRAEIALTEKKKVSDHSAFKNETTLIE